MNRTRIAWTDYSWNPFVGCDKVSAGCRDCYAEGVAKRFWRGDFKVTFHPKRINDPIGIKKPVKIFVCSMSDLFHEDIDPKDRGQVFDTIRKCPQHTFLVLTKRPQNINIGIPDNVWLGVTVENNKEAWRIETLKGIKAKVRFISFEPLLERIDFDKVNIEGIDWVIVGGESGKTAREMDAEWAEEIYGECRGEGVAFFFKQRGDASRTISGGMSWQIGYYWEAVREWPVTSE